MAIDTWFAFAASSFFLLIFPGPIAVFTLFHAISLGRRRTAPVVLGVIAGDGLALGVSLIGVGTVLALVPGVFSALKICGGAILIVMGGQCFFGNKKQASYPHPVISTSSAYMFWSGFALAAMHPSGFVFFTSFVPQFVSETQGYMPQAIVMAVTFLAIGGLTTTFWLLAGDIGRSFVAHTTVMRFVKWLNGIVLVALGGVLIFYSFI